MANDHGWMVTMNGIQTELNIDELELDNIKSKRIWMLEVLLFTRRSIIRMFPLSEDSFTFANISLFPHFYYMQQNCKQIYSMHWEKQR